MLILEDYWDRNADLRGVPIYQASGLARRALGVFQTYIAMMNEDIKAAFGQVCPYLQHGLPESAADIAGIPCTAYVDANVMRAMGKKRFKQTALRLLRSYCAAERQTIQL